MGFARWTALCVIGALFALADTEGAPKDGLSVTISYRAIANLIRDNQQAFTGFRQPSNTKETESRRLMQELIRTKLSKVVANGGGKGANHIYDTQDFTTTILDGRSQPNQAACTNYIAVLSRKQNDTSDDKPLLIVADYDTDESRVNAIEDNGSGLAAMLVVAEFISNEIKTGNYTLKHSIIFAATDASIYKYESHASGPPSVRDAQSGAEHLAKEWLPKFLVGRKGLRGTIVLDSILNYQDADGTQNVQGIERAYPHAKAEMAKDNYAGNFLAVVARGDDLDKPLVEAVEEAWQRAAKQKRGVGEEVPNYNRTAKLIPFVHEREADTNILVLDFLKSAQHAFWNQNEHQNFGAILLTDTRSYRTAISNTCSGNYCLEPSLVDKNLYFAHRTVLTLHSVIVDLQSGASTSMASMLTIVSIAMVGLRQFWF